MASPTSRESLTRDSVPPQKGHFIKKPGAETRLLSSDGRKHPLLSLLVAIPVTVHDERTKTMADPLYGLVLCGEIEGAARAHRHPAHIPALFGSLRHDRPHQVARDRMSTRLNSSHRTISYAVFCLKKKNESKARNLLINKDDIRNGCRSSSNKD